MTSKLSKSKLIASWLAAAKRMAAYRVAQWVE
jgi:hypothetical protein